MARELQPEKLKDGKYAYSVPGTYNNEKAVVDPKDPIVKNMDEIITAKFKNNPGMSDKEKTQFIREVVNANVKVAYEEDYDKLIKLIEGRDANKDRKVTATEANGKAVCIDTVAHTDYFHRKNGIDSHVVVTNTSVDNVDHVFIVSNGNIVETTNDGEPTYTKPGNTEVADGWKINYIVPKGLKNNGVQPPEQAPEKHIEQVPEKTPEQKAPNLEEKPRIKSLLEELEPQRLQFGQNTNSLNNNFKESVARISKEGLKEEDLARIQGNSIPEKEKFDMVMAGFERPAVEVNAGKSQVREI